MRWRAYGEEKEESGKTRKDDASTSNLDAVKQCVSATTRNEENERREVCVEVNEVSTQA